MGWCHPEGSAAVNRAGGEGVDLSTGGTALFLDPGTWRRMRKAKSLVPFAACVSPTSYHLCSLRLFFPFPPLLVVKWGQQRPICRDTGGGACYEAWKDSLAGLAGLAIGLWLLGGRAPESFVWLEEKWEPSVLLLPHPSRVSWTPSRAGSFLAWLRVSVLLPLGSCLDHFSFVSPRLY